MSSLIRLITGRRLILAAMVAVSTAQASPAIFPDAASAAASPRADLVKKTEAGYEVPIPAGKAKAQIESAIQRAMRFRGWTGREAAPGHIEATYIKWDAMGDPKHTLILDVRYDERLIQVSYKDSVNLTETTAEGTTLHRSAASWHQNLADDIQRILNALPSID